MTLELQNIHGGYGRSGVLEKISFSLESGQILCILGPNGAGKSTLFKGILGLLPFSRGRVLCDGEDISTWSRQRMAQTIGYIPQSHIPVFQFTAIQIVLMGRTAHLGRFATPSKKDVDIAEHGLDLVNLSHRKNTLFTEMSGGERQLVLIARSLAQRPRFLIMDEPTNNLDFGNQVRVLHHVKKLAHEGIGVIMASHYPDHAMLYASQVLLIKKGQIHGSGTPADIVTETRLHDLYGVKVNIANALIDNGRRAIKVCVPSVQELQTA
ncbi:ABC transporter ATP-binding protein [Desulfovibrio inopinatus]|uniref:ABC transporter ATP-binding protein n=1 Tax=Desulfovibrio inopinatus TaxID=102109 RepID=UPI00041F551D|nr:ABC transporter ATP-binding protein [Desulfovibrio inopinatus]